MGGGIQGIGGPHGPAPERPVDMRERNETPAPQDTVRDGVSLSTRAQDAAMVSRVIQVTEGESDIRMDRVAAARENLEQGLFQRRDVVADVAARIERLMP